jgi:hypothetical protein
MYRKRPCRICRRWFWPDTRAGDRQKTCSRPGCQRERHRRACADWHRRNPDYDREGRLRRRVVPEEPHRPREPLDGLAWPAVRDAVGLQVAVIIDESGRLLERWTRDAVNAQLLEKKSKSREEGHWGSRDEMARGP